MPRTKLDKFRVTKADTDAKIIRKAMIDRDIKTARDLAERIGTTESYMSKCFKRGFSDKMKRKMHSVLRFSESDWKVLFE